MGGKTPIPQSKTSYLHLPYKQRLRMLLSTKTSGYLWQLIDNCSCKLTHFATYYEDVIGKEYAKEYVYLDQPKHKQVLHIGCGAYPLTALILAKREDVKSVVGIDSDPHAVRLAQVVVKQKQLQHRISIEHADGVEYSLKRFDVVVISSCSWPKLTIVDHVLSTAKKNSTIVLRELNHIVPPVMQCIHAHPNIVIQHQLRHSPFPFRGPIGWQSYYLLKK